MQLLDEAIRYGEYGLLLSILAAILFIAGCITMASPRQAACFLTACIVTVFFTDAAIFFIKLLLRPPYNEGSAVIFVLGMLGLTPMGFIGAWIGAAVWLWKKPIRFAPAKWFVGPSFILLAAGIIAATQWYIL